MQTALAIAISFHLIPGVFWAGSNFTAARPGIPGERLFFPQMGAAVVTIVAGMYLWSKLHEGSFGSMEKALTIGAGAAILAFLVQLVLAGPAVIAIRKSNGDPSASAARVKLANRLASALLLITIICMGIARYV